MPIVSILEKTYIMITGLLPVLHQAIARTNADLLSIKPLRTNIGETWLKI